MKIMFVFSYLITVRKNINTFWNRDPMIIIWLDSLVTSYVLHRIISIGMLKILRTKGSKGLMHMILESDFNFNHAWAFVVITKFAAIGYQDFDISV